MSNSFLKNFFLTAAAFTCLAPSAYAAPENLSIHIKTSHYMNMGQTITRIAVGNPTVATVIQLPGSASEFLIVTKDHPGSTALFVWTMDGVRHEYLIVVSPEDPGQAMLIEQAIGLPNVHVKMVGERILLTGTVENQYEKNYALQTARLFVDGGSESSILVGSGFDMSLDTTAARDVGRSGNLDMSKSESKGKIIDMLQILHPTQIRLEAQIIEINSENTKDLGFQYGENSSNGTFYFGQYYHAENTETTNFAKP
ncbi:MAG: pilus assembly protein N-terminal domain-containing protein, partial [Selenomonadaceae bacterium]|nr:pilus assembly protein N-terminal domain-containing protein [Selenomonadaceae bacterium]